METKLDRLRKQYDIPDVPYLPLGKVCLVFRMPSEEKTAGGLYVPEDNRGPKSYGVLVAAGLAAREILRDALIEIGDIVHFGRYEGDESEFKRVAASSGIKLLQLKVEGILGSVDALKRVTEYEIKTTEDNVLYYKRKKAA